jgi:hypothetical protein
MPDDLQALRAEHDALVGRVKRLEALVADRTVLSVRYAQASRPSTRASMGWRLNCATASNSSIALRKAKPS